MTDLLTISQHMLMDEAECVRNLLDIAAPYAALEASIMKRAVAWTEDIRKRGPGHGVEAFLNTYGLDTEEGVALMCLAEALLRIPDAATADALIRDTFEGRDWNAYVGGSESWLLHFSSWGLLLTGKVVDFGQHAKDGIKGSVRKLTQRLSEPVLREALRKGMEFIGGQFVFAQTMKEALKHTGSYTKQGYRFSFDMLGEGARNDAQAQHYLAAYRDAIGLIAATVAPDNPVFAAPGISVKLSALHPRYQLIKQERVMAELLPRIKAIALQAKAAGIALAIDAEEASRLDVELLLIERLAGDPELAGWNGLGIVVQAYQKRAVYVIDWLAALAQRHNRVIPLRLVKGAYWDSEIKWAQLQGLPSYPVFTRKEHTDVSYLACARRILEHREAFYPQFATHNARTVSAIMAMAEHQGRKPAHYEFQRLHGMGEALHDKIVGMGIASRIYAPIGAHKDLLAYLIRRMLENGANSSFVHLLMDESKTAEEILADPVAVTRRHKQLFNPAIPLPKAIYADRKNSGGIEFGQRAALEPFVQRVHSHARTAVASIADTTPEGLNALIEAAHKAFPAWSATAVEERAACLERAADLLEKHRDALVALCAQQGRKTLADGIGEVREAADYCRYYAVQARTLFIPQPLFGPSGESNVLTMQPRGVFACISPWNFPLAIFLGQVTAALATGNCVIAKPAEQTPAIAARAIDILHEAGIPKHAVQLATGPGETIGAALMADERIKGVAFTGSMDTARLINRTLAARNGPIVPLIAETGGQNAMVVDSSALPEQAVDDIITSAFGSAGQRCSALRVLFVQDDIADELLHLLSGAMQELTLGDPLNPATDIGPVIDADAKAMLLRHIERMKRTAKLIALSPPPAREENSNFVPPHLFEIAHIGELTQEVFGPVLHVIRFKANTLPQVIEAINSTGFGLTFGVHSRIEAHMAYLAARAQAGNIYINRSMIGATVGLQPFGGEGLSGTGPKAGGPHYLLRFITERTVTVNTAAIGGNIALLSS